MIYRKFDFRHIDRSKLIDENYYNSIVDKIRSIKQDNTKVYQTALSNYTEICKLTSSVWDANCKESRYIHHAKVEAPPTFKADLQRLERQRNEAIRLLHGREYAREYRLRSAAAKGDLLAAGFEEWVEFNPFRAITDRKQLMEQVEGIWQRKQPTEVQE